MGWLQDTIWNNAFVYSHPISYLGAICYGILAVLQVDVSSIITNRSWLVAYNIFIGLCGLVSLSVWFKTDLSFADPITSLIDLRLNIVKSNVKPQTP
jgi:uncharacterized membrane protein YuzA (DUF378 family)